MTLAKLNFSTMREGVRDTMKEYECVQVGHHKKIAKVIQEHLMDGWRLHTYQATGQGALVTHYLLFERG
jgi:hypothetical protein